MITLRIVHSYEYATGEVDSHEYELEVDQPYNPTIMRDMRDTLMSMGRGWQRVISQRCTHIVGYR